MESTGRGIDGARSIDLRQLAQRLAEVPDTRHPKGRRYALGPLLLLIVLAKLAGADHLSGIAEWIEHRSEALRQVLQVSWPRMPHHNTYRRILAQVVTPAELDRVVSAHLQSLSGVGASALIALDGKTVRGSRGAQHPEGAHLLAAYLPAEGIVLGQVATDTKANEISVAPTLLAPLNLRGKVVAGDAMHTQRALSQQILDAGGHYLWFVKDNHPTFRAEIAEVFTADERTVLGGHVPLDRRTAQHVDKTRGRLETRTLTASRELVGYSDWPGLRQVFQLDRRRVHLATGAVEQQVVYGVTSLTARAASPAQLLTRTRAYWGIENGLHHCRDVTFHEDRTRLTGGHAGHVMATLTNLVIGLFRHARALNLAAARRQFDAHLTLALSTPLALSLT